MIVCPGGFWTTEGKVCISRGGLPRLPDETGKDGVDVVRKSVCQERSKRIVRKRGCDDSRDGFLLSTRFRLLWLDIDLCLNDGNVIALCLTALYGIGLTGIWIQQIDAEKHEGGDDDESGESRHLHPASEPPREASPPLFVLETETPARSIV